MTSDARHPTTPTSKARGDAAKTRAADFLAARGLVPVAPNYRVARGPQARGEVDLIMHDADGTLVFIEVRAASIGAIKNAGSFSLHSTFCADSRCRHPVASTSSASSGSRRVAARRFRHDLTLSLPGSGGGVNRRAKGVSYDP